MSRTGSDATLFLRRSADIERAKRSRRRVSLPQFNMVVAPGSDGGTQIAVIVGRKFGPATSRNRAKRRVRALARAVESRLQPQFHVLVFPKVPMLSQPYPALTALWEGALTREGLLRA
ncbi:MAG: ribonuclease P protein component [Nitrospiraceae bacterium]